ncbi:MAG: spermidine/putrescine ABC transporter substrate-binding protein [Rhodospirillaceae bacterium TMED8]|nr:spermidine/putrescine ABC transporter substrate-binding protein [Magnetovibrio sp.]OUT50757.1 MAG: spermidine/putrescine ABC transporter substrate-binding protein [Rhodospirillaceae bacterium TMED8]|tara:strand:- start:1699 stop:2796 length:1098 start_codon:yes stop_codon:yes gene_type:complete
MKLLKTNKFAIASALAAVAFGVSSASGADQLTVVSWGGAYTKSQVEAYHKPYTKQFGTKILSENYSGGLAEIKAQVEAKSVKWDLVDLEMSDAIRGCDEGLLETVDISILPKGDNGVAAKDDFIDGAITDCAIANIVWSTIYAYDKSKFSGKKPQTMADFFDTKKFPGKRGMRKTPKANLEFALTADGVPARDVYKLLATKEGVNRAFKKLDTIKSSVIWWEAGAQPPQLLADGEVAMTTAYNGRIFNAIAVEKKPFEIVWDGQVFDMDLWAIPKGAKNKAEAMKFLAFSTDTKRLAGQAAWISYGPARKSSIPLIGKHAEAGIEMGPHMPTAANNFKNVVQNDFEFWADRQDELNERFNAWLAK